MSFIETYGKELLSLLVPFATWILNRFCAGRVRLQVVQPHRFTFLLQEQPSANDTAPAPADGVAHTNTIMILNNGRVTATNVEVVFNFQPQFLNVWPPRSFTTILTSDRRHVLVFESLAPKEQIWCEVLAIKTNIPEVIVVRCDQCVAEPVETIFIQKRSKVFVNTCAFLLLAGIGASVYIVLLLLQFLVLKTPFNF